MAQKTTVQWVSDVSGKDISPEDGVTVRFVHGDFLYTFDASTDELEDFFKVARKSNRPGRKKADENGGDEVSAEGEDAPAEGEGGDDAPEGNGEAEPAEDAPKSKGKK